jgi:iron complex outermembrane receptor protein
MMSSTKPPHLPLPLCLLMAAVFPVHAQTPARLGEIVVTAPAEHLQQTENVVKPHDIAAKRAATSDTAALLADQPGMALQGAGGVSSLPVIHGLADDRLRIKVDGMDLIASCPNHMNPALSYIAPSQLGSLRVYAGITPVSVGGDSIGGAIVAETPAPLFAETGQGSVFKGELGAFYRSNGSARGGNAAASYATETLSLGYAGALAQADNHHAAHDFHMGSASGRPNHLIPRDEVGSTAYETRNHALTLATKRNGHLFEARLGLQDLPYQLYPNQRMDMLDNRQQRINLRYQGRFGWGQLETRLYHESVEHFMDFGADKRYWYGSLSGSGVSGTACAPLRFAGDPAGTCAAGMPMQTDSHTRGALLKADLIISPETLLRLGSELQQYRLDDWWPASGGGMGPGTFWNIHQGERDRLALFGEWEAQASPRWQTLIGARFERVATDAGAVRGYVTTGMMGNQASEAAAFNAKNRRQRDNNWDLSALARYTPDGNNDIELGLARKVRSPNLYERYTWSSWAMAATMNNFVGDGNGYVGNIGLQPEVAHTASATFAWHTPERAWELKATPHYTRVSGYIDAVKTASFAAQRFNVLSYANQSARIHGLDLSARLQLAIMPWGVFTLKGIASHLDGKNRDTGDDLYNIMPTNARFSLAHQLGGWYSALEFVTVQKKDNVSDVRNEIRTPGYSLMNLRISHTWQKVRLDFGIDNLFDKFYYLPLGGAYTGQGRTMAMNPTDGTMAWGSAVAGQGRSIYTGITMKF